MRRYLPWRDGLRRGIKKSELSWRDYISQSIYKWSDFTPPPFPQLNITSATPADALMHVRGHIRNCMKELSVEPCSRKIRDSLRHDASLPPRTPKAILNECCDNIDAILHAKLQERCFADALRAAVWKAEEKAEYYSPWSSASKCAFSFTIPKILKKSNVYWTQWIDMRLISPPRGAARAADIRPTLRPYGFKHHIPLFRLPFELQ
jgi:hypothetical protein